jgi:Apea-like HEPN
MKVPSKILGKLLSVTKGIYLIQPAEYTRMDVFFADTAVGRRQITWWITDDAVRETQELAGMAAGFDPQLAGADRPSIHLEIDKVLKNNFFNGELFNVQDVLRGKRPTLFAASAVTNKQEFAERLWSKLYQALSNLMPSWLILYPLRGVASESVGIGFDGLSLLASHDGGKWQAYATRYPRTISFDPSQGSPERFSAPTIWGIQMPTADENRPFTWLICEAKGTRHGVKWVAANRMRTFLAVLFSYWHPTSGDLFAIKSDLAEHRYSLQFASAGDRDENSIACESIGRLMPSLPMNFAVSAADVAQVKDWYIQHNSAHEELQRRAVTASHFIHHAVMADGLERFLHYYIALDALFGEPHKVDQNIKRGIEQLFPNDQAWVYRAKHLFDLRNALVHGGTSSIDGWEDLESYMRHVQTSPLEDVSNVATTALRTYPINPPQFLALTP